MIKSTLFEENINVYREITKKYFRYFFSFSCGKLKVKGKNMEER